MIAADTQDNPARKFNSRDCLILAVLIGISACLISIYLSGLRGGGAGDLRYTLLLARDWLSGLDPYLPFKLNLDTFAVPYPFTGVILTIPLTWLPDKFAAGIFSGIGAGLLAWFILAKGENWMLLVFLSWPFINNLIFTQWSSYIVCMFFTASLLPFVLVKPQLALPFALTQKPNRVGIIATVSFLLISLLLYPSWPSDWIHTVRNFIGYPPLLVLPLGPLLLFALIRYRERRAWLLVLMAAMPQRMVYDQLGVLLLAENRKQQLFLVLCSWISLPVVLNYHGWENVPLGWQNWVLIASYLPALIVVLMPTLNNLVHRIFNRLQYHPSGTG